MYATHCSTDDELLHPHGGWLCCRNSFGGDRTYKQSYEYLSVRSTRLPVTSPSSPLHPSPSWLGKKCIPGFAFQRVGLRNCNASSGRHQYVDLGDAIKKKGRREDC